jgi:hypothetical protein
MATRKKKNALEVLTVQEIDMATRKSGVPMAALGDESAVGTLGLLLWLGYFLAKRENQTLEFEDYARTKTLPELTAELGFDEDE